MSETLPKAVDGLHLQKLADEVMVYNEADGRAHALNPMAAAVLEQCNGTRDRDELVDAVAASAETPVDLDVIDLALNDLVDAGLIEGGEHAPKISRRSLIRKMGVGTAAAAALPIVESVITPAAANSLGSGPAPTPFPTTLVPTFPPTYAPTYVPTYVPTQVPTPAPTTFAPTPALTPAPTTLVPTPSPIPPTFGPMPI